MTPQEADALIRQAYSGVASVELVEHGISEDWAKVIVTMDSRERVIGWICRHNVYSTIWEILPRAPEKQEA